MNEFAASFESSLVFNDERRVQCEKEIKAKKMKMHDSDAFFCAWNPKRDLLGTGSGDSTARIWNVEGSELPSVTPEMLISRSIELKHSSENDIKKTNKDVTSIDWNSEGTMLATGCYDGVARIWSTEGELVGQLGSHRAPIFALRWNERGNHILSAGIDKTTIIWDSSNHREKQIFNFHSSSALDVDWMTDDIFVSCSTDTRIHVCQLGKNQPLRTFHGHTNEVNAVRYDKYSQRIASCSDDLTLKIWSIDDDKPLMDVRAHDKEIYTIRWAPYGFTIARYGELVGQLGSHKGPIFALRWNERGNHILSAGIDKTTIIWDSSNHREKQIFNFHSSSALDVDWMTDDIFVSCSRDTRIHVCQLGKNQPLRTFHGHTSEVNAVRYDKYSHRIASCSDDFTLKIWSKDDDKPLMDVRAHDKEIYTIRWAPYGSTIASASFDNKVRLWDVEKQKMMVSLEKHIEPVYSVSFSPDCRYLASGSFDRCIHIWDLRTNDVVSSYTDPADSGGIFEVNWNSNGQKLGASCSDGAVLVLDVRHLGVDHSAKSSQRYPSVEE